MIRFLSTTALISAILGIALFTGSVDDPPPSHDLAIEVRLVNLYVTVLDEKGGVVQGLDRDDFHLREDGRPQSITHFTTCRDSALSLAVLLDASGSMSRGHMLDNARKVVHSVTETLSPTDEMALFTFTDYLVKRKVPFTRKHSRILDKTRGVKPSGDTALFQAVNFTPQIMGTPKNRQAILLLSDGIDTHSIISMNQMLRRVRETLIPIYTVGFTRPADDGRVDTTVLQAIAGETGGAYFEVRGVDDLPAVVNEIVSRLRFQYLIGYSPDRRNGPGTYRAIKLETGQAGRRIFVRRGYVEQ